MTTRSTLIAARALVARGWCQGAFATDQYGAPCSSTREEAACFCMEGAVIAAEVAEDSAYGWAALCSIAATLPGRDHPAVCIAINNWNDAPGRTQAEVLAAFDRAIEECGDE